MSYVKHDWVTGEIIDASKLNNVETGVQSADGADWDSESDESGFIKNKPFYSEIKDVENLPKKYWENFELSFTKNLVEACDLEDEVWKVYTDKNKSDCYGFDIIGMNLEQLKKYCVAMGQTLPTEEEIQTQYGGSWDTWAEQVLGSSGMITYLKDFTYTPKQFPDMSKYISPVFAGTVNDKIVNTSPYSYSGYNEDMEMQLDIDMWGSNSVFNLSLIMMAQLLGSQICAVLAESGITGKYTEDDFLAIAGSMSNPSMGIEYTILSFYTSNVEKLVVHSTSKEVTYTSKLEDNNLTITTTTSEEGTAPQTALIKLTGFDSASRQVCAVYKITASEDITSTWSKISYGATSGSYYNQRWYDCDLRILLDGKIIHQHSGSFCPDDYYPDTNELDFSMTAGDHYLIVYLSYSSLNYSSIVGEYLQINFILSGAGEGQGYTITPSTATLTLTPVDSAVVTEISHTYSTTLNYQFTSAKYEDVSYLNDKFIEKPEWWFGNKTYVVSTPTILVKNITGEEAL